MNKILVLISLSIFVFSCNGKSETGTVNYREEMRNFVISISNYSRAADSDFIIVPQNGQELFSQTGDINGAPAASYIAAINGTGRENTFYGDDGDYSNEPSGDDDVASADEIMTYNTGWCDYALNQNIAVLSVDYCYTQSKVDDSYSKNAAKEYISTATARNLDSIPAYPATPYNTNTNSITSLSQAKNFLYLINPQNYASKDAFIEALKATDFDVMVIDLYVNDEILTAADINQIRTKNSGGTRIILCYMSIGEAEDYRYYWQTSWLTSPPSWLEQENGNWAGNYGVRYWDKDWQKIITGNSSSYNQKIIDAGFDGVYLDIIDAYENFEN